MKITNNCKKEKLDVTFGMLMNGDTFSTEPKEYRTHYFIKMEPLEANFECTIVKRNALCLNDGYGCYDFKDYSPVYPVQLKSEDIS